MESSIQTIEGIYSRKVSLFKELINCLDLERDDLINLNIENLWSLMEKKQRILVSIEDEGKQIKNIMEKNCPDQDIPERGGRPIMELTQKIADLKEEIKVRVKENVTFIRESLDFFDEIISIFAKGGRVEHSYRPTRKGQKTLSALIYHKEV